MGRRRVKWREIPSWKRYEVSNTGRVRIKLTGKEVSQHLSSSSGKKEKDQYYRVGFHDLTTKKTRIRYVHRLVAEAFLGMKNVPSIWVDHINEDRLDNRVENLRICSPTENLRNITPPNSNNKHSKKRGISKVKKRWRARIQVDGKPIYLGDYHTECEAIAAREKAEKKYWGDFVPKKEGYKGNIE